MFVHLFGSNLSRALNSGLDHQAVSKGLSRSPQAVFKWSSSGLQVFFKRSLLLKAVYNSNKFKVIPSEPLSFVNYVNVSTMLIITNVSAGPIPIPFCYFTNQFQAPTGALGVKMSSVPVHACVCPVRDIPQISILKQFLMVPYCVGYFTPPERILIFVVYSHPPLR